MAKKLMKRGSPLLWFLILPLLFSCAGFNKSREPTAARLIEKVPFYPQEAYQCGPASLAGVLNYWGVNISPAEIAAEIYSPKAAGTLDIDMAFYAEKMGLKANQYQGSLEDLKRNIDSKYPMIVLVDYGFWVYQKAHFMVVVGYDESVLIVNSGREQHKRIPLSEFLKTWGKTKFWTLRITPK